MRYFHQHLKLNVRESRLIAKQLDEEAENFSGNMNRATTRHPLRISNIPISVEHPEGGSSRILANSRNVSKGGISVLHGGYLHIGSVCQLVLKLNAREFRIMRGVVRYCRHVADCCHEIGIQFTERFSPIDGIWQPLDAAAPPSLRPKNNDISVHGSVLIAEPFEPDQLMLEQRLKSHGLCVVFSSDPDKILHILAHESIDLTLFGFSLSSERDLQFIESVKSLSGDDPLIVMTADYDPETIARAREAGAVDIMAKPLDDDLMDTQLQLYLGDEPDTQSCQSWKPGPCDQSMNKLIARYVEKVHHISREIRGACMNDNFVNVRELCSQLKGSGLAYGFRHLTIKAMKAIDAIDRDFSSAETRQTLEELQICCHRMQINARNVA